jgi:hypothetical protein
MRSSRTDPGGSPRPMTLTRLVRLARLTRLVRLVRHRTCQMRVWARSCRPKGAFGTVGGGW